MLFRHASSVICPRFQLFIMFMDVIEGIQQRQEQTRLPVVVKLVAGRTDQIDVVHNIRLQQNADLPLAHRGAEEELIVFDVVGVIILLAQSLQIAHTLVLAGSIHHGDGVQNVLLRIRFAVSTGCVAGSSSILEPGKAMEF